VEPLTNRATPYATGGSKMRVLLALILLWVVALPSIAAQRSSAVNDRLIVPGERIGRVKLGASAKDVVAWLGQPDVFDAGYDYGLMSWPSGDKAEHGSLTIAIASKYQIVAVMVLGDSRYATSEGLHVNVPEQQVRDALGEPARTVAQRNERSLQYSRGILFNVNYQPGDAYQTVTGIQIVSPNCFRDASPDRCAYLTGYH
jgi:hypothetical protein